MFGMSRRAQEFVQLGHKSFSKALLATARAIEDPTDSLKDETLMAVLLLSLFEVSKPPYMLAIRTGDVAAHTILRHP